VYGSTGPISPLGQVVTTGVLGEGVGTLVGAAVDASAGVLVGAVVDDSVGSLVGAVVDALVGALVSAGVGAGVGATVGLLVSAGIGFLVGTLVGAGVGSAAQHKSRHVDESVVRPVQTSRHVLGLGLPSVGHGSMHPSKKLSPSGQAMAQFSGSLGAKLPSGHSSFAQHPSKQPLGEESDPTSHTSTHALVRGLPSVGHSSKQKKVGWGPDLGQRSTQKSAWTGPIEPSRQVVAVGVLGACVGTFVGGTAGAGQTKMGGREKFPFPFPVKIPPLPMLADSPLPLPLPPLLPMKPLFPLSPFPL
jgi:hypothetical protein